MRHSHYCTNSNTSQVTPTIYRAMVDDNVHLNCKDQLQDFPHVFLSLLSYQSLALVWFISPDELLYIYNWQTTQDRCTTTFILNWPHLKVFEEEHNEMKQWQKENAWPAAQSTPCSNIARQYSSMGQHPRLSIKSLAELSDTLHSFVVEVHSGQVRQSQTALAVYVVSTPLQIIQPTTLRQDNRHTHYRPL